MRRLVQQLQPDDKERRTRHGQLGPKLPISATPHIPLLTVQFKLAIAYPGVADSPIIADKNSTVIAKHAFSRYSLAFLDSTPFKTLVTYVFRYVGGKMPH